MPLKLLLHCLDDRGEIHQEVLFVPDDTKTVEGVKLLIETELGIPACDQQLTYSGTCLRDGRCLSELYLRDKDVVRVEYSAKVDVLLVKELVQLLQRCCRDAISSPCQAKDGAVQFWSNSSSVYELCGALDQLGQYHFLGWKSLSTSATRRYFTSRGGLDAVVAIYRAAVQRRRYHVEQLRAPAGDCTMYEPIKCLILTCLVESSCLSTLWNYSETVCSRMEVLKRDTLALMFDSLLSTQVLCGDIEAVFDGQANFDALITESRQVVLTSVGCIVQFVEFEQAQVVCASKAKVIGELLNLSNSQQYDLYTQQIAANTLFCCSCSRRSQRVLAERDIHVHTLKILQTVSDIPTRYFLIGVLANLRSAPEGLIREVELGNIDNLLWKFAVRETFDLVAQFEEEHTYVWINLRPFLELAFASGSGRDVLSSNATEAADQPVASDKKERRPPGGSAAVQRFGLFCIMQLCSRVENCSLFVNDGLFEYLQCLPWMIVDSNNDIVASMSQMIRQHFKRFVVSQCVPSLRNIVVASRAHSTGLSEALQSTGHCSWMDTCLQRLV